MRYFNFKAHFERIFEVESDCKMSVEEVVIGKYKVIIFRVKNKDEVLRNEVIKRLFLTHSISYWFRSDEEMYLYFESFKYEIFDKQIILIY